MRVNLHPTGQWGWAVGDNGAVCYTPNWGLEGWYDQRNMAVQDGRNLLGMAALSPDDDTILWAVGEEG
eukprot:8143963-Pyramimonas_sp.AAC.1